MMARTDTSETSLDSSLPPVPEPRKNFPPFGDDSNERASKYTRLGEIIREQAPYGEGDLDLTSTQMIGWLRDFNIGNEMIVEESEVGEAEEAQCYRDQFGDESLRVTKAMRVHYTYRRPL